MSGVGLARARPLLSGRHLSPGRRRQMLAAAVAAVAMGLVAPLGAPVAIAFGWCVPAAVDGRAERRRRAALADDLPDVIALLGLAVGAGFTVTAAVAAVGQW